MLDGGDDGWKGEGALGTDQTEKRSPNDFALWKAVNRRMRKAERKFPRSKFESRQKYISRLQRTARNLPRSFINKVVGDMARRCKRLYARKGGLFEEGGRTQ